MTFTIIKNNYRMNHFNVIKYLNTISTPTVTKVAVPSKIDIKSHINVNKCKNFNFQIRGIHMSSKNYQQSVIPFPPGNPKDKAKIEHLLFIKDRFTKHVNRLFILIK